MMYGGLNVVRVNLKGVYHTYKTLKDGTRKKYYYHRATNTRLPDDPQSEEFQSAYYSAQEKIKSTNRNRGTLKSIIQSYQLSSSFKGLRDRTRKDYLKQIAKIENKFGQMPILVLNDARVRGDFLKWRDRLAKNSPKQADYAISVLGIILSWALDRGIIAFNHATRPRKVYKSKRVSKIWLHEDVSSFLSASGSELQLALILARDTGQRQGDLLKLSWGAYDGTYINLIQSKTGAAVEVPVTQELKILLTAKKASGVNAMTILTRPDGQPWKTDHFRHAWREATLKAGVDGLTFNDLRGTAVTALADAGCTTIEIASITGHSLRSVEGILEHYVARTRAQANAAIHKLENARRTNSANQAANLGKIKRGDQK